MSRFQATLFALLLVASACSSDGGVDVEQLADLEGSAAALTDDAEPATESEPLPTAVPEPTAEPTRPPDPEPTPAPEPTRVEESPFADVDAAVQALVEREGLEGAGLIVVHRDDGVLHHQAYGGFEIDRISMVASASKMISAGVLLHLQDQGVLDIEAPVTDVAAWELDHPEMVPAQLVSNSSGLVGLLPNLGYEPYLCQWSPASTLQECGETIATTPGDDDDVIPPDTTFRYGGAQWQVAGALAEIASGRSWAELVEQIYVRPCGLSSLGYLSLGQVVSENVLGGYPTSFGGDPALHEPSANPNIEGGAHISTADYGTLLLMHLRGGVCEGGQVLSQEALDAMHTDRIAGYGASAGLETGYGMGWWVDRSTGIISDGGAWGAYPWLNLDGGYGGFLLIEDSFQTSGGFSPQLIELVHLAVTGEELS